MALRPPLAALKEAVKQLLKAPRASDEAVTSLSDPSAPGTVEDADDLAPGSEGERLVRRIHAVLVDGLHPEAETWHYLLNLEREPLCSLFPLAADQVRTVRQAPDWPDPLRVRQWIRMALNQGTLLAALQLLSLFPVITRTYYTDGAAVLSDDDSAALYGMLAPVAGLPWAERRALMESGGLWPLDVGRVGGCRRRLHCRGRRCKDRRGHRGGRRGNGC